MSFIAHTPSRMKIAVAGSGVSGLSAAWLLSQSHDVTLYESASRLGGHSHTVTAPSGDGSVDLDTGFIVFNEPNYPNLTALFRHLKVPTKASDMSFAVSLDEGRFEYAAKDLLAFLAQPRNLFSPRFWGIAKDVWRFYRHASRELDSLTTYDGTLGEYLCSRGFGEAFQRDHLFPQAAAIWSASLDDIRDYPACAFIRFFENHGLMKFVGRPEWRTVDGGSRVYVEKLAAQIADIRLGAGVRAVTRDADGVTVRDATGHVERFDHIVIGAHADQALAMLADPSAEEGELLGAFRDSRNLAVLHSDPALMPKRKALWSSWNYVDGGDDRFCTVTYWMNKLQRLKSAEPLFVTLNPPVAPRPETVVRTEVYEHPVFDKNAIRAQRRLWSLQGTNRTWFCGAHFGSGFHEDGLQSGLAVAEQLGGVRRPWAVAGESARIWLTPDPAPARELVA